MPGQVVAVLFPDERNMCYASCEALIKTIRLHIIKGEPELNYYVYTVCVRGIRAVYHETEILCPMSFLN